MWAFHGMDDQTVPYSGSTNMINHLNQQGGTGKITLYENTKHNSWTKAYSDTALYDWLLNQKKVGSEIETQNKKQYVGEYLYQGNLSTFITLENENLWYSVPYYNFKVRMYQVEENLFRFEGIPLSGDSELLFTYDDNNEINGHYYSPCDGTFVPKMNSDSK